MATQSVVTRGDQTTFTTKHIDGDLDGYTVKEVRTVKHHDDGAPYVVWQLHTYDKAGMYRSEKSTSLEMAYADLISKVMAVR